MPSFTHSLNIIGRCTQMQRGAVLKELGVCGGQVPYLLRLCRCPGLTQEELAKADAADPTGKRRELLMASWEQMEQTDAVMYQTNMATYLALPTDEEVETLDFYTTDLDMAMTDLFIDLINGTKDIDNLDEYLEELRALGLDEVIGVYQARYDRFKGEA